LKNQTKKELSKHGKYRYYKKIRRNGLGDFKTVPYNRRLAIKYYCLECVCFNRFERAKCTMPECSFFPYRFGTLPKGKTSQDRNKAIRSHCMGCCSGDHIYVAKCPDIFCSAYPFRFGYKTDKSTLIPANTMKFNHEDDKASEDSS